MRIDAVLERDALALAPLCRHDFVPALKRPPAPPGAAPAAD